VKYLKEKAPQFWVKPKVGVKFKKIWPSFPSANLLNSGLKEGGFPAGKIGERQEKEVLARN